MTLDDLNRLLNLHVPITTTGKVERITFIVAKFRKEGDVIIDYDVLENELLNRTERLAHKWAFKGFFVRLRKGDTFKRLLDTTIRYDITEEEEKARIKGERKSRLKQARKKLRKKVHQLLSQAREERKKQGKKGNRQQTVIPNNTKVPKTTLTNKYHDRIYITTWGDDPYTPPPMEE